MPSVPGNERGLEVLGIKTQVARTWVVTINLNHITLGLIFFCSFLVLRSERRNSSMLIMCAHLK